VRKLTVLFVLFGLLTLAARAFTAEESSPVPEVPVKDMVTMVDVGADKCIPCKMMAPILKSLQEEYKGKAAILFIDVWKNPEQSKRFGINAIPTQIFYNKEGREIYRHEGFISKGSIREILEKALASADSSAAPSDAGRN